MSTERGLLAVLLALAVLASPALAQEPEPPVPEEEALGDVPVDAAEPGEPPRPVDDDGSTVGDDPDDPLGEETTEAGLGSYFLTSFALAGANDRVSGTETVTIPGTRPPGRPTGPVGPPTVVTRDLETDETGWLVRPSFLFVHRPSARGGVVVAYEPEFEQLDRGDSPDRISHSAGLTLEHRATRRT